MNEYYFKDEDADLDTLVKNKIFLLDKDRRVGGIEWDIDEIIEKI